MRFLKIEAIAHKFIVSNRKPQKKTKWFLFVFKNKNYEFKYPQIKINVARIPLKVADSTVFAPKQLQIVVYCSRNLSNSIYSTRTHVNCRLSCLHSGSFKMDKSPSKMNELERKVKKTAIFLVTHSNSSSLATADSDVSRFVLVLVQLQSRHTNTSVSRVSPLRQRYNY